MSSNPVESTTSDDAGPLAAAMAYFQGRDTGKSKWGQRIATATMAYHLGGRAWRWANTKRIQTHYQIAVYDTDALYRPVQDWVLERMPKSEQRALIARLDRQHKVRPASSPNVFDEVTEIHNKLDLYFDGSRPQDVVVDGHKVTVQIERDSADSGSRFADSDGYSSSSFRPARILFATRTEAARDAVITFLGQLTKSLTKTVERSATLHMLGRWGDWHSSDLRARPLDSVILADGQLERILADIRRFYASEARYNELGIPWHRGYVFHGPPGTGKTSTARALASALGLDVYYMPLGDLKGDTDLARVLSGLGARHVLLLEDIDVFSAARERSDDGQGLTLSGLLQTIDGVVTPHGMVTIMTTNVDPKELDDALIRPGRADLVESMGYLDDDQFRRLLHRMVGLERTGEVDLPSVDGRRISPADVVDVVKRHLETPDAALAEMGDRFRDRPAYAGNGARS